VAFSPDGKTVVTGSKDYTARLWQMPVAVRADARRIRVWTQVLTGTEMDEHGSLHVLDAKTWHKRRKQLMHQGGTALTAEEDVLLGHQREASEAEIAGQWFGATWHLTFLINAAPADGQLWKRRAQAHFQMENWDQAVADYARTIELSRNQPGDWRLWYSRGIAYAHLHQWEKAAADFRRSAKLPGSGFEAWAHHACLSLFLGDSKSYRQACRVLFERWEKAEDLKTSILLGWTAALGPDSGIEPQKLLRLAETIAQKHAQVSAKFVMREALLFRAGNEKEAIRHLNEFLTRSKGVVTAQTAYPLAWLFMAMAYHRQGQLQESKKWLAKAVHLIDKATQTKAAAKVPAPSVDWLLWLGYQILRREAETLEKGTKR
jgi:tetratricopeptide (TPR) repeat protein